MNRHIKKLGFLLAVLMLCAAVAGCQPKMPDKEDVFRFVEENQQLLLAEVHQKDYTQTMENGMVAMIFELEHAVNFYCGGEGVFDSSHMYGFYYSYDGQAVGVSETEEWADSADLTPSGNGYAGEYSGNQYYTEKICENFWYYELHT
jgi:hypothetical protein